MIQRISLLFFFTILSGICIVSLAQSTSNYADTLIHVGAVTVSKPFFIRDIRNYIASTNSNKVDSSNLNNWYNNYINDLILTNCAIDNGFLKRADVDEHAVGFENYVLIQKGSSFYNANINSKIVVSPEDVKEAYNKMSAIVSFSLIRFSNEKIYQNTLKGQMPSNTVFEGFKNTNNDSIKFFKSELIWPSLEFWFLQYQIESLKVGEISSPINVRHHELSNPVYLIRVDSIRKNSRIPFDLEKQRLEVTLNQIKEDSLYDHYEKAIFQKANIQLNEKNLSDSLVQCFINHCKDPKNLYFIPYLKVLLMKYFFNGVPVLVHTDDFLKYYRNLPVRLNFRNRGDVINFLYYFVLSDYMVQDASIANFDKEVKFLSLKKELRNKFALQKFEEELFDKVSVSDMECETYYHDHFQDYNGSTYTEVTLLSFDSENDATTTETATGNADTTLIEKKAPENSLKSYEESKSQIYLYLKGQKFIRVKDSLLKQAREKYLFYRIPTFKQVENLMHWEASH